MPRALAALLCAALALLACTAAAARDSDRISCRIHVANNTGAPTTFGRASSSLQVLAAADISDVSVILQLAHPDVAALEVTLKATPPGSKLSKAVVLKAPAYGASGGANMVQTIFSDYAPAPFAVSAASAPYSSVFRPHQSLKLLASGSGTSAGAGGSAGVWTLSVADKATGTDLSRRPLKLTGWELWLCGASNGPLFAPDPVNAFADDAADDKDGGAAAKPEVSVLKKAVAPSEVQVSVLIDSGYRLEEIERDPVNKAVDKLNTWLASELAPMLEGGLASLLASNPQLATTMKAAFDGVAAKLGELPAALGYLQIEDGSWSLPSSEEMVKGFLETLQHCYYDLAWCWQNTGLRGSYVLDFVSTWDAASGPLAATWAAAQKEWLDALAGFEEAFPQLNGWSDVLFYATINGLYNAAAMDAVVSVGEAWADTAIRFAIWASPVRFAINPRAFFTQTFTFITDVLRSVFEALEVVPELVDGDNNNDLPAITEAAQALVDAASRSVELMLFGLDTRASGMQRALINSAGGLARGSASMNDKLAAQLKSLNPELGAMFEAASQPVEDVLSRVATNQQQMMAQYFRQHNARAPLRQQLDKTIKLTGEATVQLANNTARAVLDALDELDAALPGPSPREILGGLQATIEGILFDAQEALKRLLPLPEIEEVNSLISATINSLLEMLRESVADVQDSDAAEAVRADLGQLAGQLRGAQEDVASIVNGIIDNIPGPLVDETLAGIKRQADQTAGRIQDQLAALVEEFPNLDVTAFLESLGADLESLLSDALDQAVSFFGLAPPSQAPDLATGVQELLGGVIDGLPQLQGIAKGVLPAGLTGVPGGGLDELQQGVANLLDTYATRVTAIADAVPLQPALADITGNLATRSQQLSSAADGLVPLLADVASGPSRLASAGLDTLNSGLAALLEDLRGQQPNVPELAQALAEGPLAGLVERINATLADVTGSVQDTLGNIQQLLPPLPELPELPPLPDIRQLLNDTLGPAVDGLSQVLQSAAEVAVAAIGDANAGLLEGLGIGLKGLTQLLINAQWQLASLLNAAVAAGQQLDGVADLASEGLAAQLQALDQGLATLVSNVSSALEAQLSAVQPPEELITAVIRPLAQALNDQLGALTALLQGGSPQAQLPALLAGVQQLGDQLLQGTSAALQLPAPGPLALDLPSLDVPPMPAPGAEPGAEMPYAAMPTLPAQPLAAGDDTIAPGMPPPAGDMLAQLAQALTGALPTPASGGYEQAVQGMAQQLMGGDASGGELMQRLASQLAGMGASTDDISGSLAAAISGAASEFAKGFAAGLENPAGPEEVQQQLASLLDSGADSAPGRRLLQEVAASISNGTEALSLQLPGLLTAVLGGEGQAADAAAAFQAAAAQLGKLASSFAANMVAAFDSQLGNGTTPFNGPVAQLVQGLLAGNGSGTLSGLLGGNGTAGADAVERLVRQFSGAAGGDGSISAGLSSLIQDAASWFSGAAAEGGIGGIMESLVDAFTGLFTPDGDGKVVAPLVQLFGGDAATTSNPLASFVQRLAAQFTDLSSALQLGGGADADAGRRLLQEVAASISNGTEALSLQLPGLLTAVLGGEGQAADAAAAFQAAAAQLGKLASSFAANMVAAFDSQLGNGTTSFNGPVAQLVQGLLAGNGSSNLSGLFGGNGTEAVERLVRQFSGAAAGDGSIAAGLSSLIQDAASWFSGAAAEGGIGGIMESLVDAFTGLFTPDGDGMVLAPLVQLFGGDAATASNPLASFVQRLAAQFTDLSSALQLGGGADAGAGRRLLQAAASASPVADTTSIPAFSFTLPALDKLAAAGVDGPAFMQQLAGALAPALTSYANNAVAGVKGLSGASTIEAARALTGRLTATLDGAAQRLRAAADAVPRGPVLTALLQPGNGSALVAELQGLSEQLGSGKALSGEALQAVVSNVSARLRELSGGGGAGSGADKTSALGSDGWLAGQLGAASSGNSLLELVKRGMGATSAAGMAAQAG